MVRRNQENSYFMTHRKQSRRHTGRGQGKEQLPVANFLQVSPKGQAFVQYPLCPLQATEDMVVMRLNFYLKKQSLSLWPPSQYIVLSQ